MSKQSIIVEQKNDTEVFICHGKSCSKNKNTLQRLSKIFPSAKKVKCLKVCKGPVVLVKKEKGNFLFKRIKKMEDRLLLWEFIKLNKTTKKLKFKKKKSKTVPY